jgi:hypothetical protein
MSLTAWSSNRVYPHHRLRTRLRSGRGTTARKVNGLCPILLRCQWPGASTSWRVNPVLTPAGRRIDLVGLENIPESGPLIVALNHQDALVDPMLLPGRIPRRFGAGCQGALFRHPLIGPSLRGGRESRCGPRAGFRAGRALLSIGGAVATADCIALHAIAPDGATRRLTERLTAALRRQIVEADDRETFRLLCVVESMSRDEAPSDARGPAARTAWMQVPCGRVATFVNTSPGASGTFALRSSGTALRERVRSTPTARARRAVAP